MMYAVLYDISPTGDCGYYIAINACGLHNTCDLYRTHALLNYEI